MADTKQNTSPEQESFLRRVYRTANAADPFVDVGLAGGIGVLLHRLSRGRWNLPGLNGSSVETVAPKLSDEANFGRLLRYIETAGQSYGMLLSEHLNELNKALMNKHNTLGQQFRELLFSGMTEEKIIARIDKLFSEIDTSMNDAEARLFILSSKDMVIQHALSFAQRVEDVVNRTGSTQKNAALAVANHMIENKELPGSFMIHTEESLDALMLKTAQCIQRATDQRNQEQEKPEDPLKWVKILLGTFLAIFMISSAYRAMTDHPVKKEVHNPIAPLEQKLTNKAKDAYQWLIEP